MPLTKPIPKRAMPVIEVLRRDVKRPSEPPTPWHGCDLRWNKKPHSRCPMGLHPFSRDDVPTEREDFLFVGVHQRHIQAFYLWWDRQTDAAAAVEAVWPTQPEEKKP